MLAYVFKFQPSELMDMDDEDIEFWTQRAREVTEALKRANTTTH